MTAEALYAQLKELADSEPNFGEATAELARWPGRLHDVVERAGARVELIGLKVASDNLVGLSNDRNAQIIRNIRWAEAIPTCASLRLPGAAYPERSAVTDQRGCAVSIDRPVRSSQNRAVSWAP